MPNPARSAGDAPAARDAALPRRVVVIGASLGGIGALRRVLGALPADFPAPVLVVQHLGERAPAVLAQVLGTMALPVGDAVHGERMRDGRVYLAPAGLHLRAEADATLSLSADAPVHGVRPSADVLFRSAAAAFDGAVVAVVLTGARDDGAGGVLSVRAGGGTVIAQDPDGAAARGMPESSIRTGAVDLILPLDEIAPALVRIARESP